MEKTIKPTSGWAMLLLLLLLIGLGITLLINREPVPGTLLLIVALVIIAPGFIAVSPNTARVLTLFGAYIGTIKESGFFYTNPFYTKKQVTLRAVSRKLPGLRQNPERSGGAQTGRYVQLR